MRTRTVQLPNGPAMPRSVPVVPEDLMYPKAWGLPALREGIATYYQTFYGTNLSSDNVMVFAGGRSALIANLLFLDPDITVRIASTEYTPYCDMLERLGRRYTLVSSSVENGFSPSVEDFVNAADGERACLMLSNPCNPASRARVTTLKEHTAELMALSGVVGTAQSLCAGRPCIKVYVVRGKPALARKIHAILTGYPVVVEETGTIRPRPAKQD